MKYFGGALSLLASSLSVVAWAAVPVSMPDVPVEAGVRTSGGGFVKYVLNAEGRPEGRPVLLDLWLGQQRLKLKYSDQHNADADRDSEIELVFERLARWVGDQGNLSKVRARQVAWLRKLIDEAKEVAFVLPRGGKLPVKTDQFPDSEVEIPGSFQVAYYNDHRMESVLYILEEHYENLSAVHQAGLMFHEALYRNGRSLKVVMSSMRVQEAVAYLMADEFRAEKVEQLLNLLLGDPGSPELTGMVNQYYAGGDILNDSRMDYGQGFLIESVDFATAELNVVRFIYNEGFPVKRYRSVFRCGDVSSDELNRFESHKLPVDIECIENRDTSLYEDPDRIWISFTADILYMPFSAVERTKQGGFELTFRPAEAKRRPRSSVPSQLVVLPLNQPTRP